MNLSWPPFLYNHVFFFKWVIPGLFLFIFVLFEIIYRKKLLTSAGFALGSSEQKTSMQKLYFKAETNNWQAHVSSFMLFQTTIHVRWFRTFFSSNPTCRQQVHTLNILIAFNFSDQVPFLHVDIYSKKNNLGREPWSSGYGMRLMFQRS